MDWDKLLIEIEDLLFPRFQLDVWERTLYYHLLRHTHLIGITTGQFSILKLAETIGISDWKVREVLRSLHAKGCVTIEERTNKGHLVRVMLPEELDLHSPSISEQAIDIETVDFFVERKQFTALLEREQHKCFYCLRSVTPDIGALDHVTPQVNGGNNSYRNIVVACHECNARKQDMSGQDFLRHLYRRNLLSEKEFEGRLEAIDVLQQGKLVPRI